MTNRPIIFLTIPILIGFLSGCGVIQNWQMIYGKPAAQFHAQDVASKGKPFLGKKITVKGTIDRIQKREDGEYFHLEHDVHFFFPAWHWGGGQLKPGDEVYVDGYLETCEEGDVEIAPAMSRDPYAPFSPMP